MYKKVKNTISGQEVPVIKRISDNAFIPVNSDNTDYQEYLKWIAEGGVPEPADE